MSKAVAVVVNELVVRLWLDIAPVVVNVLVVRLLLDIAPVVEIVPVAVKSKTPTKNVECDFSVSNDPEVQLMHQPLV